MGPVLALKKEVKMKPTIEYIKEKENFWVAHLPSMPGVIEDGKTKEEAIRKVMILAFRVMLDDLEDGDSVPNDFIPHLNSYFGNRKSMVL